MDMYNIDIEWQLQPGLPMVRGNVQLLQQVLLDIIVNAKWAIQKKPGKTGGSIVIRTHVDREKSVIDLSVSDTGVGIPKENLDRIFEPFFTTKNIGEGTGLGLSIVGNIIKEHKGTISAESEVGKGTMFKISLPYC
jgi:signal transduction histidine kinase